MSNELVWQTKLLKQAKREGGHGNKWGAEFQVGVPDLVLATPCTGLVLVEVKLERVWNKNTERTIGVTPIQAHEMQKYHRGGGRVGVLVVIEKGLDMFLWPMPFERVLNEDFVVRRDAISNDLVLWDDVLEGYAPLQNVVERCL